jgi:IclR family transcriptional regulator, acetate operon repressor
MPAHTGIPNLAMNLSAPKKPAPGRLRASARVESDDGAVASGSLSRGLQILDVLRQANGYLSLSDIAAETGLDASTAHRLLQTLTDNGYAVRDEVQKRYLPGPRALSPLSLFHPITQLRREAGSTLHLLQKQTGCTSALALFIGQERLVVDFVQGSHPLSPYYESWLKSPLHGSASGRLLLSWMSESEREQLLGAGPYEAHTSKTITDPVALSRELDQVRVRGYATARDDYYDGLMAIGVPLVTQAGAQPLGSLLLTGPSDSVPVEAEEALADQLKAASRLLMNGAPSMQKLKQWSVRGASRRAPANPAMA